MALKDVQLDSNILSQPSEDNGSIVAPVQESTSIAQKVSPMSQSETDPNKIKVTIADKTSPIVVLYGPPSCGKTMTLIRLARWLNKNGFQVVPDKSFRGSKDTGYQQLCDNFNSFIDSNDAAKSTNLISFMLVKILDKGRTICQILEAPGEHYYNPGNNQPRPPYVSEIINAENRKLFAVILDAKWTDASAKKGYVDNVRRLNIDMQTQDKVLFVYNKIDQSLTCGGALSTSIKEVSDQYPGIFVSFVNQNPITKMWRKFNCGFVTFSTGNYAPTMDGTFTYTPSRDEYPRNLWNAILQFIKG
ncbi:ATP-binding protein [Prevotella jejuni]